MTPSILPRTDRFPLIDAFKAIASQLIVLHHLAFYGPMSDWTLQLAPDLVSWLSQDARMAVQVFLVVGGYLAARSLAPDGVPRALPWRTLLWQRYVRVALPYVFALWVAMAGTELARLWMQHDSLPAPPEVWQFVAHALLLQSLLDMESLSAGVWYVAIDFQLFALLMLLLWYVRGKPHWQAAEGRRGAHLLVFGLVAASLFHFNRDAEWDDWGLYFFGAYGLGVLTCWAGRPARGRSGTWTMLGLTALTLLALAWDFRARIAVALLVALTLSWAQRDGWLGSWPRNRLLSYLGRISYSVFLLNFPVSLLLNALFTRFGAADPVVQTVGVVLAWLACNLAGAVFFHTVEHRIRRWSVAARRPLPRPVAA